MLLNLKNQSWNNTWRLRSPEVTKSSIVAQHVEQWRSKSLHGQGQWSRIEILSHLGGCITAHLKPVTEALLTAGQDQAICTNWWLACHILGTANSDLCRRCIARECWTHHGWGPCDGTDCLLLPAVHWSHCGACGFEQLEDWWNWA